MLIATATMAQKKAKAPPPPPPPPAVSNSSSVQRVVDLRNDYEAFLKRNPEVKRLSWSKDRVRVYLKNGKQEAYEFSNAEQMKQLENKFGELPPPPPPPPAR